MKSFFTRRTYSSPDPRYPKWAQSLMQKRLAARRKKAKAARAARKRQQRLNRRRGR